MGAFYAEAEASLGFDLLVSVVKLWKKRVEALLNRISQGLSHPL
jgi:hypothetical protein